jgi:hypothetical protein
MNPGEGALLGDDLEGRDSTTALSADTPPCERPEAWPYLVTSSTHPLRRRAHAAGHGACGRVVTVLPVGEYKVLERTDATVEVALRFQ